jgi:hypothetical protein
MFQLLVPVVLGLIGGKLAYPCSKKYEEGGEIRNFDRHKQMDSETFDEVFDLIREFRNSELDFARDFSNYLYGLFDGYDYSKTEEFKSYLLRLQSENSKLYDKVVALYEKIGNYNFYN